MSGDPAHTLRKRDAPIVDRVGSVPLKNRQPMALYGLATEQAVAG